jgi:hypothetical protein
MPAPTVLAILALAPLGAAGTRRWLLPLPLAWCVVEAVTQAALGTPAWPLLPLAALLSLLAGAGRRPRAAAATPQAGHPG